MSIRETNKWLIPVLPPTEFAEFLPQSVVIYKESDVIILELTLSI